MTTSFSPRPVPRQRPPHRRGAWLYLLLLLLLPRSAATQGEGVSLSGTVTAADGAPVAGATVRAEGPGPARQTVTDAVGAYRLRLEAAAGGETAWEVRVERIGFFPLAAQVVVAPGGPRQLSRDFRLSPRTVALPELVVEAARPAQRPPQAATPGGNEEVWQPFTMDAYPLPPGDLGAVAAHRAGVLPLGGDGDGLRVSILGRPASQTGVLLDGASFGAAALPAEALRSSSVISSTYDPSRGRFSGGQIAATTRSGTNLTGGAVRFRLDPSWLQTPGGPAAGGRYGSGEVGAGAGGALVRDRLFWYAAVQGSRRTSPAATLASAGSHALAALGISPDSVARLRALTEALGAGTGWSVADPRRESLRGTGLLRLDYHLTQAHTLTLRLDGRGARVRGFGATPLGVSSGQGRATTGGGVLGQLASYLGGARNELRLYHARELRRPDDGPRGPAGAVQVPSLLADGTEGFATLQFGPARLLGTRSRGEVTELADELLLGAGAERSRVKLGFTLLREQARDEGSANADGTFLFRSLQALQEGRPALFTRTLDGALRRARAEAAGAFAAHFLQLHQGLWLIYGARVDAGRFPGAPALDPAVRERFGAPATRVPSHAGVSPRAGFTFETPDRRWEVHGGVGHFRGTVAVPELAAAFAETGRADGERYLVCAGPAAPEPLWTGYEADPASIPRGCAGGEDRFASAAPAVTWFAPGFDVPRTWNASLGTNGDLLRGRFGQLGVHADLSLVRGLGEPLALSRNHAPVGLALADEGGRPVFAPAGAFDAETGAADPALARLDPAYALVREVRAGGRSRVAQLTVGGSVLTSRLDLIAVYYTHTRATDQVTGVPVPGGFSAPVTRGDPNARLRAPSDVERRHMLQAHLIHPVGRWLEVGVLGRVTSGEPFTPRVDADVNADGLANDAAFVFDPATTANPALAAAMQSLLSSAPRSVRGCLARQLGRVAERNGCRGPWTTEADLQVNVRAPRGHPLRRAQLTLTATNLLGGLDLLVNGRAGVRGWGSAGFVDPTLLQVRGFDATAGAFRYEVNPAFGVSRGRRDPFRPGMTVAIGGRVAVGADPATQPFRSMINALRARGRSADELRREVSARVPNLPRQVLALADSLALELSPQQRAALAAAGDSAGTRMAPLADSLAVRLSLAETSTDMAAVGEARRAVTRLASALQREIDAMTAATRAVLTAGQWARLPDAVRDPSRQIVPDRPVQRGGGELW